MLVHPNHRRIERFEGFYFLAQLPLAHGRKEPRVAIVAGDDARPFYHALGPVAHSEGSLALSWRRNHTSPFGRLGTVVLKTLPEARFRTLTTEDVFSMWRNLILAASLFAW